MKSVNLSRIIPRNAEILCASPEAAEIRVCGARGGGAELPGGYDSESKYLIGDIEILEDHGLPMMLRFYDDRGADERAYIRFVLLPRVKTRVCFELSCVDLKNGTLDRNPGMLKQVVYGTRAERSEIKRVELGCKEAFHDVRLRFENFYVSDDKPEEFPLPEAILADEFGQWNLADWPGKTHSLAEMEKGMRENLGAAAYPLPSWNRWGGDSARRLAPGTGFFSRVKTPDGRWHLTDPDGCDYFSMGVCVTRPGQMGDVTYTRAQIDVNMHSPENEAFFKRMKHPWFDKTVCGFDFGAANLKRVFGEEWREKWAEMTRRILMESGINSQGNGAGLDVDGETRSIPYVRQLRDFPRTKALIFRDFPDVLSPEYLENSRAFARQLLAWANDPWLIGYFLCNEPNFGFIQGVAVVNEVLHNPLDTHCRRGFIAHLQEKYKTVRALNAAWGADFSGFDDLMRPFANAIAQFPGGEADIRAYSRFLVSEFCRVPSDACRAVDKNHMNLGMRWAKMNNPDVLAGWENFDVFSFNCYTFDLARDLNFITGAGVDLPLLVGEYHSGALDRGLPSTGLKGVENQEERGHMWRMFVETLAAHPFGVGAHWFQYQDEFCLGRFDGENYQIGLVDICMRPYPEMMRAIRETALGLYRVRNAEIPPTDRQPKTIPMVG